MKLILLVFLVFASTCSSNFVAVDEQRVALENERFLDIVGGLSSLVSQLIASVKQALRDLVNLTGTWIHKEVATIESVIKEGIKSFNDYIKNVEKLINETIKPCIAGVPLKIETIKNDTIDGVKQCQQAGLAQLMSIQYDVQRYQEETQKAIGASYSHIQACFSAPNFGDKVICAVNAARNVTDTVEVLRVNIAQLTSTVSEKIKSTAVQTHQCVSSKLKQGHQKIEEVLKEARECLKQTTTQVPEQTTSNDDSSEGSGSDTNAGEFIFLLPHSS